MVLAAGPALSVMVGSVELAEQEAAAAIRAAVLGLA